MNLTLGEIRKGIDKLPDSQRKQALSSWLEKDIPLWFDSRLLVIDEGVADCWGKLQAQTNKCVAISLRVFGSASFACKSGKA